MHSVGSKVKLGNLTSERPMLYSEEALAEAQERLLKLYSALRGTEGSEEGDSEQQQRFMAAMANDAHHIKSFCFRV